MQAYDDLWAKTGADGKWHPLLCHLLDVGAAAEALLQRLPKQSLPAQAGSWVVLAAAAHDVGKCNPAFQSKSKDRREALRLKQIDEGGYPHGYATIPFLQSWLKQNWSWSKGAAHCTAKCVAGHHGSFPMFNNRVIHTLHLDEEPYPSHGKKLLDDLAETINPENPQIQEPDNTLLAWLAGFVSVADWLGSHYKMTVFEMGFNSNSAKKYWQEARQRANELLNHLWQQPVASRQIGLSQILPERRQPRPLQVAAAKLAQNNPTLAIIEAPTGEGKTEAAMLLAEPSRSSGLGIYFALPTMATANGLLTRVERYIKAATNDESAGTKLLHSQSWLYKEDEQSVPNTNQGTDDPDDNDDVVAEDWFEGGKRGLLAPYAVGTVDQALVGVLNAKHFFVRLFGLAGKTVVIDEVHAYDVYMSCLLETLLKWLKVLGCRVVLLSATLPEKRRNVLLAAWGVEAIETEYPCITAATSSGVHSETFQVRPQKHLAISYQNPGDEEPHVFGANLLADTVKSQGGHGVLLLNTVREAQEAYEWLQVQNSGVPLTLFHARFTAADRAGIEKTVLGLYGPTNRKLERSILVATQVVEQSLDLDFDHMVTSLAPIDLLLQRAGRLHRHSRDAAGKVTERHDQRPNPTLFVVANPNLEDMAGHNRERIYSNALLLLTEEAIKNGESVNGPSDIARLVEMVYGNESNIDADREALIERAQNAQERVAQRHSDIADQSTIPDPGGNLITGDSQLLDDQDEGESGSQIAARTRLEEIPSVTISILPEGCNPDRIPNAEMARKIAMSLVRIPALGKLYRELMTIPDARGWKKKRSLAFAKPVRLDSGQIFTTTSFQFWYDAKVGLRWRTISD